MRKVTIELKVNLSILANEGVEISEVINELDYNFSDTTGHADILDTEIQNYEILDSK